MSNQASFVLRSLNPDVLTCIANLWADKTVKFLDPFTKSGVFLREITSRLTKGLEKEIPDLEKRVNHILTKQVFGIAITQVTSLLARRSLYCSNYANGEHSIAKSFAFLRLCHCIPSCGFLCKTGSNHED